MRRALIERLLNRQGANALHLESILSSLATGSSSQDFSSSAGGRRGRGAGASTGGRKRRVPTAQDSAAADEGLDLMEPVHASTTTSTAFARDPTAATDTLASAGVFRERITGKAGHKPILIEDEPESEESEALHFDHGNKDSIEPPAPKPAPFTRSRAPPASSRDRRWQEEEEPRDQRPYRQQRSSEYHRRDSPRSPRTQAYDSPSSSASQTGNFFMIKSAGGVADLLKLWRGSVKDETSSFNPAELGYLSQRLMIAVDELRKLNQGAHDGKAKVANWSLELEAKKALTEIVKHMNNSVASPSPSKQQRGGEGGAPSGTRLKEFAQALTAAGKVGARIPPDTMHRLEEIVRLERETVRSTLISKVLLAVCTLYVELPDSTADLIVETLSRHLDVFTEPPVSQSVLRDCITALHSLVRLNKYTAAHALLTKLESSVLASYEAGYVPLTPRNISGLFWSYAHLDRTFAATEATSSRRGRKPAGVLDLALRRLGEATAQQEMTPSDVGYILWALAKNGAPKATVEKYYDTLIPVLQREPQLHPEVLSMVIWAVGSAGLEGAAEAAKSQALDIALASLRQRMASHVRLSAAAASSIIFGLGKLGRVRDIDEFTQYLGKENALNVASMRVPEASSLLWTWASLGFRSYRPAAPGSPNSIDKNRGGEEDQESPGEIPEPLMVGMLERLRDLAFKTELRGASTVLWSLAKLDRLEDFDRMVKAYELVFADPTRWGKREDFSCLAMFLFSLSQARYDIPGPVLAVVQDQLADKDKATTLDALEVANLLYFHADMAVRPPPKTLETLLDRLNDILATSSSSSSFSRAGTEPHQDPFPSISAANCAWALAGLATMDFVPVDLQSKLADSLRRISELVASRADRMGRVESTQLFHAQLLLRVKGLESMLPLPQGLAARAEAFWKERARSFEPSTFAVKVASHLMALGLPAEAEFPTEDGLVTIDLALPQHKVAIECDGPNHFVRNTGRSKGRRGQLADILLRSRGWKVIHIPYWDFERARGSAAKRELVRSLLHKEGLCD